ncbi:hypothetical protein LTR49_018028 [Elasticomyces elasticus]|nr:hypothetical protein LTR49_018028 [Elasticomyces elasticus]
MLAGVVYCTGVLGVEVILPSDARETQAEADDERFRQQQDKYLANGTYSINSLLTTLRSRSEAWSFITHQCNVLLDKRDWMLQQAFAHAEGRKLHSAGSWSKTAVQKYLRQVDRFRELLLLCIHITGGQPDRGSEITTIRFRNGFLQDRNVFVIQEQLVVVTRYHKSQSQFDKPKAILCFLPWRVGQLLAIYLTYVQALQQYLSDEVRGSGYSDDVWSNEYGPWGTKRLTKVAGKKREGHARSDSSSVGSEQQHVQRRFALARQNHRIHGWAEMLARYGQGGSQPIPQVTPQPCLLGKPLEQWHSASITPSVASGLKISPLWSRSQAVSAFVRDRRTVGEAELKQTMRKALRSDDVTFRLEKQREALYAVVSTDSLALMVVVLPTGGGKSLLFMAPACLEDAGVTVVVVPYRALLEDLLSKAKQTGIDCMEFKRSEVNPVTLVFVSGDVVEPSMGYAWVLEGKGLLRRIFVDKSHLTFTSSNWRPKLEQVRLVRGLRV